MHAADTQMRRLAAGSNAEAVQIGEVEVTQVQDTSVCGTTGSSCQRSTATECEQTPDENLRTFYDGATRMQQLYHSENIKVQTDNPQNFDNDRARLARRCAHAACVAKFGPHQVPAMCSPLTRS